MDRNYIAVPIGDPAGVGPEIVVKSLLDSKVFESAKVVVIGDKGIMENAIEILQAPLRIHVIEEPDQGKYDQDVLNLIDLDNVDKSQFEYGKVSAMCGQAAFDYIKKSIELAMDRKVAAVSTTPINKEALRAAEIPYIGHTEIFGPLTNAEDPLTMFEVHGMRVFFLSRHVSLREACDMVKKDRIIDYVHRCTDMLKRLGVREGTMAIAGLNPHCGEH